MKIIKPSFELMSNINSDEMLKSIESCGRVCYKSEDNVTETSAKGFIARIIKSGHESVIEHEKITVKIICDRGVSHIRTLFLSGFYGHAAHGRANQDAH